MPTIKNTFEKGINQDVSKEMYPKGMYFNLENGRVISDTDLSIFNVQTVKGNIELIANGLTNKLLPNKSDILIDAEAGDFLFMSKDLITDISDDIITPTEILDYINSLSNWNTNYIVGGCSINNDLILFTRLCLNTTSPDTITDTNQLGIWRLRKITDGSRVPSDPATFVIDNIVYSVELIHVIKNANTPSSLVQYKIDSIGYYERERIQNIYWIDGINSLRKLNISEPRVFLKNNGLIDVITESKINPPVLKDVRSNGSLNVGQIQYAYSYYIPGGQKTYFSLPCPLIHLTTSNEKSDDSGRQYKGSYIHDTEIDNNDIVETTELKNSGKSVTISFEDIDTRYEYVEIVSIHYTQLNSEPTITVVYRGKITDNFTFTDYGTAKLETYSNALYSLFNIDFIPQTMAVKDNILFVGNIREKYYSSDNWESFDTRAFRYDNTGNARLYDTIDEVSSKNNDPQYRISGTNYSSVGYYNNNSLVETVSIEDVQTINAINRFNNIELTPNQTYIPNRDQVYNRPDYQYCYQSNGTTVGGEGPNIKYKFITKELLINEKNYTYTTDPFWTEIYTAENDYVYDTKSNRDELNIGPSSYASPYNSAYYSQYKRDEIYRFALVVFDKKGIRSYPKWIGDIRTPVYGKNGIGDNTNDNFEIVEINWTSGANRIAYSIANALGLDFSIDFTGSGLENEIQGYAIVRCDRDENRINIAQGILNNLREATVTANDYDSSILVNENGLSANINASAVVNGVINSGDNTALSAVWGYSDYLNYEFISPETTFNTNINNYNQSVLNTIAGVGTTVNTSLLADHYDSGMVSPLNYNLAGDNSTNFSVFKNKVESYSSILLLTSLITWSDLLYSRHAKQMYHSFSSKLLSKSITGNYTYNVSCNNITTNVINSQWIDNGKTRLLNNNEVLTLTACHYPSRYPDQKVDISPCLYVKLSDTPLPLFSNVSATCESHVVLTDYLRFSVPYIGADYNSRELSTYTFCGNYVPLTKHVNGNYMSTFTNTRENGNSNKVGYSVFGGDTFIGYYQHVRATMRRGATYSTQFTGVVTFPCESTINLNLRHDSYIPQYTDEFNISYDAGPNIGIDTPAFTTNIQLEDLYLYNTVFSKTTGSYKIQDFLTNDLLDQYFPNRVQASKKKIIGEFIDSWTMFGTNEFIDLDTTYGPITKLITNKDQIFAFQENAIAMLSVNDKSITQDDNGQSIVLGTGGVLPYSKYMNIRSGSKHKWSIVNTPSIIYYYDTNKNRLCFINEGETGISDVKGLNYLMEQFDLSKLNSVDSFYVDKHREIHTTFDFSDSLDSFSNKGFTIIFNTKTGVFTQIFHTGDNSKPFMYFGNNENYFTNSRYGNSLPNTGLFVEDKGEYNDLYNEYNVLKLSIVINPIQDKVTVLDNIEFNSLIKDMSITDSFNTVMNNETITAIRVYNSYQDTGIIDLTVNNARNKRWIERTVRKWRFNYMRDLRTNANIRGQVPRLRDYYFVVDIYFDSRLLTTTPNRYAEIGNIISTFKDPRMTEL